MNIFLALGLALASAIGAAVATALVVIVLLWILFHNKEFAKEFIEGMTVDTSGILGGVTLLACAIVWFLYFFIQFVVRGL